MRQEGAQVEGFQLGDVGNAGRTAAMPGQELQELARIALIGIDRQRRKPPFGGKRGEPVLTCLLQIGTRGDEEFFHPRILPHHG